MLLNDVGQMEAANLWDYGFDVFNWPYFCKQKWNFPIIDLY